MILFCDTSALVDRYVKDLKLKRSKPIAPSTIRKRIGVLGRVLDWPWRRVTPQGELPLPTRCDCCRVATACTARARRRSLPNPTSCPSMTRCGTRRLEPGEEERILAALAGAKRPDRERALDADPAFTMLFRLIVATGLRLREAYRLRVDQVDVTRRLIHV